MSNQQPIEKRNLRNDGSLYVHSIFPTIQGEGPFAGTPCVFVRLAGCNLQCPGCDTEYSSKRDLMSPAFIINQITDAQPSIRIAPFVVITGGEPFRQNLGPLLTALVGTGHWVQVETNGTLEPARVLYETDIGRRRGVYVVCSPKAGKIHPRYDEISCAFKYVMSYNSVSPIDGLPIKVLDHTVKGNVARPGSDRDVPIYLQPMDHTLINPFHALVENPLSLQAVKDSCLKYGYILQVQIHKVIGVE